MIKEKLKKSITKHISQLLLTVSRSIRRIFMPGPASSIILSMYSWIAFITFIAKAENSNKVNLIRKQFRKCRAPHNFEFRTYDSFHISQPFRKILKDGWVDCRLKNSFSAVKLTQSDLKICATCTQTPDPSRENECHVKNLKLIVTLSICFFSPPHHPGISRDSFHKRRATGGKKAQIRKKRKYELGRPAANTKVSWSRFRRKFNFQSRLQIF